jgi:DNA-binding CsgD family transcriptional regulator/tetratricopeptide (TPR) repeat protein
VDSIGRLVSPVLIGRDDLLELAARRLAEAHAGRGHLLFLAGEAGIGKTRLLGAIERRAAVMGFDVVHGSAFPRDLEVAAAPLLDLARAMGRSASFVEAGATLTARLADGGPTTGDAHRRRRLLLLDVTDILVSAVGRTPVLFAFEDLHWADDLTLEVLSALARRLPDVPLVVVGTYRSDELYPRVPMREWRSRLLAGRLAEEVRLTRLTRDETSTLTRLLLGLEAPVPSVVVKAVHERTDGIPLHVEELLAVLVSRGLDVPDLVRAVDVPDSLEAAVLDRLERRSRAAEAVARAGAVIGRSFDIDLLTGVVGFGAARLDRALAELTDHFFLQPATDSSRYDFRHALIRDAIYGRIPLSLRRRLHARVADLAAAAGSGSDAFLSTHFEQAGRRVDAFRTALAAARAAVELNSHTEAYGLYRRAIHNLPRGLEPSEHACLLEELGAAAAAADENAAAAEALEAARERYLAVGSRIAGARVVVPLVAARHLVGDGLDERVARLTTGLEELADLRDDPDADAVRARLLAGLSAAYMLDRRLEESLEHGLRAREIAAALGDEPTESNAMTTVGSDLVFAGRMDEGWAMLEATVRRAREVGREAEAARAYRMVGSSASVLVEYERAEATLREGIDYAERVELWNHRHYMASHLAHVLWATGRWKEADAVAHGALADGRGGITTRITALHVIGYVALGRGDAARARDALDEARRLGEAMGELQRLSPALWGLAEVALLTDDPAAAADLCSRGREASAAVDDAAYLFPFLVTGTRALLAIADTAAAERWVEDVAAALRHRSIPGTLPAIDHAVGLVRLAQGSTGHARSSLEAAASAWSTRRRAWEGTAALLDLAACHQRAHRRVKAIRVADEARATAERLASPPLLARADALLRSARARDPADPPWTPLTAREFEVARLIGDGWTNRMIADELGISTRTVGAHVEHILARLGASRRAEIARWVAGVAAGQRMGAAETSGRPGSDRR